ncbi:MAG TPA: putative entry exclusion protein TrbK-alt [Caulobacteraceae bacterium]|jgi:conjugative transfer region protein TrbK
MRALTVKGWGALGAFLVLAAVVVAATLSTVGSRPGSRPSGLSQSVVATDLDRCSHAGEAAEADPLCQAVWRRSRDEFLSARANGARP